MSITSANTRESFQSIKKLIWDKSIIQFLVSLRSDLYHGSMTSKKAELIMTSSPSETYAVSAPGSQQGTSAKGRGFKQRPLGPAPFASFEDLSDELDSPPETARIPLPGIKEDPASQIQSPSSPHALPVSTSLTEKEDQSLREALSSSLGAPAPPRIDISRASSSSQHEDSVTSSPERDGGTQTLGYKEDGTIDLRSSTEELDYIQEPGTVEESEAKRKREKRMKKQQQLKQDFCETQSEIDFRERKSSTCSVMSKTGYLYISGRTSRLSSVGSIASEASVASGVSHLSTGSHISGKSTRSPSPHKMLLETSFCGSQPMIAQTIEAEAAPALVSYMEKQASRPPSRLSSRSPSPHKMILETSFCGSKRILPPESKSEITVDQTKKKESDSAPKLGDLKNEKVKKKDPTPALEMTKEELKQTKTDMKEQERKTEVKEIISRPKKGIPVSLPRVPDKKVKYSKPKKIISIRDIPGDEIYIPLKGPEVDFEEIVRKTSPNVKRKVEKPSEDVLFIPLHSPEESEKEKEKEMKKEDAGTSGFKQNFDDGICISLHGPPKDTLAAAVKSSSSHPLSSSKVTDNLANKVPLAEKSKSHTKSEDMRKTKYEVCEDGSIFIPLHSPDEEPRSNRTFEEQIRRVDEELQKAREMAEKKLREEEVQHKPGRLDLHEYSNRQSLPPNRPDMTPVGSRTPSPGSTLSRKSSFASIFRRGDVTGSPDSSGGSVVSKKSGTFSTFLKEAGEGLRDRSRSRSKNRERQSPSPMVRSPSFKKNVFTNLFGKKKGDENASCTKADDKASNRIDQQFSHSTEMGKRSSADEGDYIIIPLRDPSDPQPELEHEAQSESATTQEDELPSPIIVFEKADLSRSSSQIKTKEHSAGDIKKVESVVPANKWSDDEGKKSHSEKILMVETPHRTNEEQKQETEDVKPNSMEAREKTESKTQNLEKSAFTEIALSERKIEESFNKVENSQKIPRPKSEENEKERANRERNITGMEAESKEKDNDLQHESSLEMEEGPVKEEMMVITTGGVRRLKLPPEPGDLVDDHERKGLVLQESFEDELPYVPTTLPLERSVGLPIIPVKQRVADVKTCPIDRPRSTTPINPLTLEEYVNIKEPVRVSAEEKMKISLPREDSISGKAKSPRRFSAKGKSWFEFAEEVSQSSKEQRKNSLTSPPSPPPLPPRSSPPVGLSTSAPQATSSWINFEEIPEKRKQPKRITTVPPLRSSADGGTGHDKSSASNSGSVVYTYVSPEDCQCECHDHKAHASGSHAKESKSSRGKMEQLKKELDSNCELTKHSRLTDKLIETQGDIEISVKKNECKHCECGRQVDVDDDIEKKPLLEYNSDGENDDSSSKREGELELTVPGKKHELDGQSLLSDSSFECPSQGTGNGLEVEGDRADMKPFEVDFDIKSNRSSLVSQDEQQSSEEFSLPL